LGEADNRRELKGLAADAFLYGLSGGNAGTALREGQDAVGRAQSGVEQMARDSGSSAVAKTLGAVSGAMEVPKQLYGMAAGANVDTFADSYDARRSQGLNVYTSSTMTVGESIPGQNMLIKAAELHDGRSLGAHDMGRDLTSVDKWSKLLQFGGEAVLWGVTAAKLPMGPSGVKSPAGATTEVARIKGTGEGAKATTKSLTEQAVDLVELNSNKNYPTPGGKQVTE